MVGSIVGGPMAVGDRIPQNLGLTLQQSGLLGSLLAESDRLSEALKIPPLKRIERMNKTDAYSKMKGGVLSLDPDFFKVEQKHYAVAHDAGEFFSGPDVVRARFWHEFAHHIDEYLHLSGMISYTRSDAPTTYAKESKSEFFAESVALLKMGRGDLVPERVRAILQARGVLKYLAR